MQHLLQLRTIIAADPVRMRILRQVAALGLADCWVAAGFVRSAVWQHLHRRDRCPLPADIDVIWFDGELASKALDLELEASLRRWDDGINWSVKNQARMHLHNGDRPYASATEAMIHWPETATAVAVRLGANDVIEVAAPFGLDDLFGLIVRPTANFQTEKRQVYLDRLRTKNWRRTWPKLKIL